MQAISLFYLVIAVGSCYGVGDDFFDEEKHGIHWVKCKASDKYPLASNLNRAWVRLTKIIFFILRIPNLNCFNVAEFISSV